LIKKKEGSRFSELRTFCHTRGKQVNKDGRISNCCFRPWSKSIQNRITDSEIPIDASVMENGKPERDV
jgi:hypothetical protein